MTDDMNGRISAADRLARIETKLDGLIATLEKHVITDDNCHSALEARIRPLEVAGEKRETRIDAVEKEIADLRKSDKAGNLIAYLAAAVAASIGWFRP